jgi:ubiquinol-cytochrome c reductase cytochrome c subunit
VRGKLLLALLAAAATACTIGSERSSTPFRPSIEAAEPNPVGGRELYLRDCAWCHAATGGGTPRGPDLLSGRNGAALTDFMLSTGRMPLGSPDAQSMPAPSPYDAEERAAIVDYVAGLGGEGPEIPTIAPSEGRLNVGLELYQENCAACHSTTLVGGALAARPNGETSSVIAPPLTHSTPREIAEAMLTGPGAMPIFGSDVFTQDEVNSIVRYVVDLQNPANRGGAPIGHTGPVTEGAVAGVVGLGAMVLLIRWIGTKIGEE